MAKLLALLAAFGLAGSAATSAAPTFYRDVLPILQAHCQTCHRPGEVAPMPLMDYPGVRPWASAIRQATLLRQMPPWFADPTFGHFANNRSLAETDIRTISDWVSAGAPEGDRADAPPPRHWIDGWTIGKPEIVLQMPVAFQIPASGVLPYHYVIVPTHFQKDTWVRLAEVRAGDRVHTHHIVVSVREPGSHWLANEPVGTPFVLGPRSAGGGVPGEFLAGYGPGALPETFAPGEAKLIKAGSDLVFQLHYTPNGTAGSDRSRIGLILDHQPPQKRVLMAAAANIHFLIPPGESNYRVDASLTLQHDSRLVSLLPHMHLRGKSFEFRVRYPNGREEILLQVPHYSYNWQLSYYLEKPLDLPAGTVVECTAYFDNSVNNPLNPDPGKAVRFGPQSWDEMMIGYFEVAVDLDVNLRGLLLKGPSS
ncbi:MAG TPA: thiol-disulfide isomerase [Bryobacteraceae bacterium]|nr:thiol-disulfide isomerase [Bryobacteraceae bacterium]